MCQPWKFSKIILILAISLSVFLDGCHGSQVVVENNPPPESSSGYNKGGPPPWAPAHGYRAKHRYHYYPSSRVYYDKDREIYFYYEDENWRVSVSLPSYIRIDFEEYVTLEMDTDKPYEYDNEVAKRYPPGQLKKKDKKKKNDKWE